MAGLLNKTPIYVSWAHWPRQDPLVTNTWETHQNSSHSALKASHGLKYANRHTTNCTFQAANPPEAGVGERPRILLVLIVGVLLWWVGCAVADEGPGVQPVVSSNSHCHQCKSCKSSHGGQQHLDPSLTPHHGWAGKETDVWREQKIKSAVWRR